MKNLPIPHQANGGPSRQETFLGLISSRLEELPGAQRRVGEAFLRSPELLGCFSIAELAQKTETSQATIIRFCRSLGFDGFLQFSKEVQQAFQAQLTATDRFTMRGDRAVSAAEELVSEEIRQLLATGKNNIDALAATIESPQFKACIEAMHVADNIFILGRLSSYPLALHFSQMLSKITDNAILLDRGLMQTMAEFNKVTERSLLFAVAFPRYPRSTLNLARQAAERGVSVVSITNSRLCPTVPFSTYTLLAPIDMASYIDVFISPITLLSALAIAFGQRRPEVSQKFLAAFDTFAEENGLFVK